MAGMFLAALDQTIMTTSIRTIADDLNGLSLQAWVTTAYLITSTLTTPLYGKLADLYGRKPLFLFAIAVFLLGSVACTFSGSMYQLAGFRALQGVGAGGLFSLALTIIGDLVSPRERARYQGYFAAVFATSSVLGPLAGGFFAGQPEILGITGWRWVFLVNVPIGMLALLIVAKVLNLPHTPRQGRAWGWLSVPALLCCVVALAGIGLFLLVEHRYGDDALLPLRFFRHRVSGFGTVASLIVGVGMFGGMAALPLYLQIVKGASPTEAGLLTLPLVLGIMSMSTLTGRLIAWTGRLKPWPVGGAVLMITGLALLSRVGAATPLWGSMAGMLVFGLGLGASMQPLTLAMQNAMPARDMGVTTASATFFRQMGGTLGTAVFLSILFSTVGDRVTSALRAASATHAFQVALADPAVRANPADQAVLRALASGAAPSLDDTSFLAHLDPRLARPVLDGFAASMSLVSLVGAAVLVIALLLVLLMPEVPLRTQSRLQARLTEDAPSPAVPGAAHAMAAAVPATVAAGAQPVESVELGHLGDRFVELVVRDEVVR